MKEEDFVTGERVLHLCDVAFFTRDYVRNYPSVAEHAIGNNCNIMYFDDFIESPTVEVLSVLRSAKKFSRRCWMRARTVKPL